MQFELVATLIWMYGCRLSAPMFERVENQGIQHVKQVMAGASVRQRGYRCVYILSRLDITMAPPVSFQTSIKAKFLDKNWWGLCLIWWYSPEPGIAPSYFNDLGLMFWSTDSNFGVLTVFISPEIFSTTFSEQGPLAYYLQVRIYLHLYFGPLALFTSPDILPAKFLEHWQYL